MPIVEVRLQCGETVKCQSGAMVWMSNNLRMDTKGGGISKAFGRVFAGESMFLNRYTAKDDAMIAFGACFPGSIQAVELNEGEEIICQKTAFLAATDDVQFSVMIQKKIGTALFGGEGFVMQRVKGPGTVFLEIDGSAIDYYLERGEQLVIDTGHLALMDSTCSIDIQSVKGVKNMFLGGEGLFNTIVSGPGNVTVQSMPKSALVAQIASCLPSKS